jgi:hypothetical protein
MPGASSKCLNCEIQNSHTGVDENQALLTCGAVLLGQVFSKFRSSPTRIPGLLYSVDKISTNFETWGATRPKTQRHVPQHFPIFTVSFERVLCQ